MEDDIFLSLKKKDIALYLLTGKNTQFKLFSDKSQTVEQFM